MGWMRLAGSTAMRPPGAATHPDDTGLDPVGRRRPAWRSFNAFPLVYTSLQSSAAPANFFYPAINSSDVNVEKLGVSFPPPSRYGHLVLAHGGLRPAGGKSGFRRDVETKIYGPASTPLGQRRAICSSVWPRAFDLFQNTRYLPGPRSFLRAVLSLRSKTS
jgi:hypothetical protein